jgi:serine phosphatase RsbU (regulator of sigma subunit)/Tfp pilus assembly protein PilF
MRRYIILVLLGFSIFSRASKLDSLWRIWNNNSLHDTVRLKTLSLIIWNAYMYSKPDTAFYYAQKEYDLAVKSDLKKYMSDALTAQGVSWAIRGDYESGIEYSLKGLKIREETGDKNGTAVSLNNLGSLYQEQGDLAKSIDVYTRSLKIAEEINDKEGVARTLGNIGQIYYRQKDIDKGIEYCTKSLKLFEELGGKRGIAIQYNSLANMYDEKNDTALAMKYYLRALRIREELGDKRGIAASYNNIAYLFTNQDQFAIALSYYERSLKLKRETGDIMGEALSLSSMSSLYYRMGDLSKAISLGERSLKICREVGDVEGLKNAGNTLYLAYAKAANYKGAFDMHLLYTQMKDSIQGEESKSEVIKKDMKYNYDKQKAIEEKEHEKELAVAEEQKAKQRILIFSITGGLILVLFFTFFVINRLRITNRQKKIIETQKKEVEVQKHQVELQKELVEEKQQEIIDSITYAKRLQNAILPPAKYIEEYIPNNFVLYQPKDIVAGDFYWMEVTDAGQQKELIFIAAADSTGHGVPGAMVSIVCSNALNKAVKEFDLKDVGEILGKTREIVLDTFAKSGEEIKDGMDVSLMCLDKKNKKISWSGANNQLWYVLNDTLIEIKADKQPVGKSEKLLPFTSHELKWEAGTVFYLMTDGYPDQFGGPKGKKFKYKQLEDILSGIAGESMQKQKEILSDKFAEWKGDLEQVDDVTIIGIKI